MRASVNPFVDCIVEQGLELLGNELVKGFVTSNVNYNVVRAFDDLLALRIEFEVAGFGHNRAVSGSDVNRRLSVHLKDNVKELANPRFHFILAYHHFSSFDVKVHAIHAFGNYFIERDVRVDLDLFLEIRDVVNAVLKSLSARPWDFESNLYLFG